MRESNWPDMRRLSGVPIDKLFFDGCNTANFGNGKDCLAKRAISELENVKYVFGWYGTGNALVGYQWAIIPFYKSDVENAGLWVFTQDNKQGKRLSENYKLISFKEIFKRAG